MLRLFSYSSEITSTLYESCYVLHTIIPCKFCNDGNKQSFLRKANYIEMLLRNSVSSGKTKTGKY